VSSATTSRARTSVVEFVACVIVGSANASRPPLTPASATPSTTTPNAGMESPVTYRKMNPNPNATSAGMTPASSPR